MTVTPPTRQQITALAERRTTELGMPPEPPPGSGDPHLYQERRKTLFDSQVVNAELGLTRRYERDRDREQQAAVHRARDEQAFEADLRERFRHQFPGAPESDFAALRPTLLAQVATERHDEDQRARARMRSRLAL